MDEEGEAEVHVFDGEVVAQNLGVDGQKQGEEIHLTEDMAIRYDARSDNLVSMPADPRPFTRSIDLSPLDSETPLLPVTDHLAFWLAADVSVNLDGAGRVVGWGDILAGDNQNAENAWQVEEQKRPRWSDDAINGMPAVPFQR